MKRLSLPSARLATAGHRLRMAGAAASAPEQTVAPWKAWYKTAEWRRLRAEVLKADLYTCRRCRRVCGGRYPADDSPVVDHIRPHRGDAALFWDRANLQVLCKSPCHDQAKQQEEQATRRHAGVWD